MRARPAGRPTFRATLFITARVQQGLFPPDSGMLTAGKQTFLSRLARQATGNKKRSQRAGNLKGGRIEREPDQDFAPL
ncbi:hypothetical protein AXX16_3628 [Serratia rubidaea]|nr:hypothetical protein AXX16_3628 [Serratia rubidaea]